MLFPVPCCMAVFGPLPADDAPLPYRFTVHWPLSNIRGLRNLYDTLLTERRAGLRTVYKVVLSGPYASDAAWKIVHALAADPHMVLVFVDFGPSLLQEMPPNTVAMDGTTGDTMTTVRIRLRDAADVATMGGVDTFESWESFRAAYLKRALAAHPDKPTGSAAEFARLNALHERIKAVHYRQPSA